MPPVSKIIIFVEPLKWAEFVIIFRIFSLR